MRTNCPNGGAPIEPGAARCPYCRTPYETTKALLTINADGITLSTVSTAVQEGIMTPNEARQSLGIRSPSAALAEQLAAGFNSFGMDTTYARLLEHGTRYLADYDYHAMAVRKKPRGLLGRLWRRIKRKD